MQQPPGNLIPFVLAIDIEPDSEPAGRHTPIAIAGLNRTAAWIARLRSPIEDATGVPFRVAWFVRLDAEIAERGGRPAALADLAGDVLSAAAERGDAIGVHSHFSRWDPRLDGWLVDHGNAAFVDETLRASLAAFAGRFGHGAPIHRFGDRWSSPAALATLAELGVEIDLTIEPGQRGAQRTDPTRAATGRIPDQLHERSVVRRFAGTGLWQFPLSSADPAPALPPFRRWARRLRFAGQPRHRTLLLDRAWPSTEAFWSIVLRMLDGQSAPYVAAAIRSDVSLDARFAGVTAILDDVASAGRRFVFEPPEQALARLAATPVRRPMDAPDSLRVAAGD